MLIVHNPALLTLNGIFLMLFNQQKIGFFSVADLLNAILIDGRGIPRGLAFIISSSVISAVSDRSNRKGKELLHAPASR